MALSFPVSPTNGQTYVYNGTTYVFDGKRWTQQAAAVNLDATFATDAELSAAVSDKVTTATMNSAITSATSGLASTTYVDTQIAANSGSGAQAGAFYEGDATITQSYTITTGKNAMSPGPLTIADGVTITIPDGSTWTIV